MIDVILRAGARVDGAGDVRPQLRVEVHRRHLRHHGLLQHRAHPQDDHRAQGGGCIQHIYFQFYLIICSLEIELNKKNSTKLLVYYSNTRICE